MTNSEIQGASREQAHDALRELMNIGSGNAVTALSRLLDGKQIDMAMPQVELVTGGDGPDAILARAGVPSRGAKLSVSVVSRDRARISYRFAVLLDDGAASLLPRLLIPEEHERAVAAGTLEESALAELGNITASAFLNAASRILGANLMPSPPAVNVGDLEPLLRREVRRLSGAQPMILMQTRFVCRDCAFDGRLMLCLEQASAVAILEQMGLRMTTL